MTPARPSALVALVSLALLAACGGGKEEPVHPAAAPAAPATASPPLPGPGRAACRDAGAGPEPSAAALRAFVRGRSRQLRDCYQSALKRDAAAGGKATLRFTIGLCGEIGEVSVSARRGKVDEAAACAVRAMSGWRTAFRPAEPVTVEYPVAFSASM